ncbi:MAG: lipopolysaccharide biosynthesis protein [Clostridia bacterium]|nr:lipopolysaccharide biosynthesis protein [Clostridia bacterium]
MSKKQKPGSVKASVISGLFWSYAGKMSAQFVSLAVFIVLARRLVPQQFGAVSLMIVVIAVANVLVDCGFSSALVQKKSACDADFSTAFCVSFGLSLFLYGILFVFSPALTAWFGIGGQAALLRVLAVSVVIQSLNTVQRAHVARAMDFRKLFHSTFIGMLAGGAVSVWLAYRGYGAWALVYQHLTVTAVDTLVLLFTVRWRPRLFFAADRFRALFLYGWKLFVVYMTDVLYHNLRTLAIGWQYHADSVAFYDRGRQLPDLIVANVDTSMNTVLFPVMSQSQDDPAQVKRLVRRSVSTTLYVLCPLLIGLAAVARPLISLMLTDKWLPSVPVLQIYCAAYLFRPLQAAGLQSVKALGRSDIFLRRDIVKKAYSVTLLVIALVAFESIEAVAVSFLIASALNSCVDFLPCRRMLRYTFREVLADTLPTLLLCAGMLAAIVAAGRIGAGNAATLAAQTLAGAASYLLLSALTRNATLRYLIDSLKGQRAPR